MRPTGVLFLLTAATTQQSSCGPSAKEVGQAVLLAQPLVFVLGLLLVLLLVRVWRIPQPMNRAQKQPLAVLFVLTLVGAGGSLATGATFDLFIPALWLFGCSYAAVLLVTARLLIWLRRDRVLAFVALPPVLIFMLPALVLALELTGGRISGSSSTDFYALPGLGGWIAGPLFLGLLIEARVRR